MKQLSLIEKAFFLKKVSLFEDLDLDMLIAVADKMNQDIYDNNEKVFEINHKATRMYFIIKGSVDLKIANKKITLTTEDFFGDEALFNEKDRTYMAICSKPSQLMTLSKTNLLTIISECPSVAIKLLYFYSKTTFCRFLNEN